MNKIMRYLVVLLILSYMTISGAISLFDDSSYKPISGDHKSFGVGQSLTVLIYEQASSASSADTNTNRSSNINAAVDGINNRYDGGINFSNDFEGGGTITRTGKLVASVTVTIEEKLGNGEFLISGDQFIEFNNENQRIQLSGRVRPEDISTNNTVLSTRVADARITYMGDGLLGQRQKPGILTRFFHWLF